MKKLCWITDSFLLDVDIPIVPALADTYDIHWIVLTSEKNLAGDKELIDKTGFGNYELIVRSGLFINPKRIFFYRSLLHKIKKEDYDMYYFDWIGTPYLMPLVSIMLLGEKVVIAAHNVKTPKGARYYWMAKPYMDYVIRKFHNFQVFSNNQFELLKSLKKDANILFAPLCLKDYGEPTINKCASPITFLFFGNIVEYKRLDVLLNAVDILDNQGVCDFKVIIAGYCRPNKWYEEYKPLIKNEKIVKTDIRRIPNENIPNLFEQSHYFVMPYQDIAQSGAMTVALRYNIPIIASDLETFKEYLNDGQDGYFFEVGNPEKLAERMKYVIAHHNEIYDGLCTKQAVMVKLKLSLDSILDRYKEYINALCRN